MLLLVAKARNNFFAFTNALPELIYAEREATIFITLAQLYILPYISAFLKFFCICVRENQLVLVATYHIY